MGNLSDRELTSFLGMSDMPLAISSCLLGTPCRYDGQSKPCRLIQELAKTHPTVSVCPEVLGGLSTPRPPAGIMLLPDHGDFHTAESESAETCQIASDIICRRSADIPSVDLPLADVNAGTLVWRGRALLINREGRDVTAEYKAGALKALEQAERAGVKLAILKQHSPSCGCGSTGGAEPWQRLSGDGVTAALFKMHGIAVISDEDL
ncbi:MAG: DUF523 domain-containing protein [bacterium]|nr:DUF523 domain-containing protein [bacterium]